MKHTYTCSACKSNDESLHELGCPVHKKKVDEHITKNEQTEFGSPYDDGGEGHGNGFW